jgi:hypothetical protein
MAVNYGDWRDRACDVLSGKGNRDEYEPYTTDIDKERERENSLPHGACPSAISGRSPSQSL